MKQKWRLWARRRLLEIARKNNLLGKAYRAYLRIKRFVLGRLGFRIATWYSKENQILSCDAVSDETWDMFVE